MMHELFVFTYSYEYSPKHILWGTEKALLQFSNL